ncbi:MAG: transposase [Nitrospirae bacterium]|nr:transposase [Nitrospirota bacterium]
MPRIPRGQIAGYAYHVINRGNGGATLFHKDGDYHAFLNLLVTAKSKHPIKLLAFCLMPNHFHLIIQPPNSEALSAFMQWWLTAHVRRYHQHHKTHGHIWQVEYPPDWRHWIETPLSDQELSQIRTSVNRQAPYGEPDWQTNVAKTLGLVSTLRPRGRPQKTPKK